jgi:hypothetical protein
MNMQALAAKHEVRGLNMRMISVNLQVITSAKVTVASECQHIGKS